jgi:hypothetical protein
MAHLSLVVAVGIMVIELVELLDHSVKLADRGFKKEEVLSIIKEAYRKFVAINFGFK